MKTRLLIFSALATLITASGASAQQTRIRVDFDVNFAETGTGFAPLASVFHDGSFSSFTPNTAASAGLEALAEGGNPTGFLSEAPTSANTGATGGQTGGSNRPTSRSITIDVADGNDRFSYASMFLPSNDWFIANSNGNSLDVSSLLAGTATSLTIDLNSIYDAGTELEDFTRGGGTGPDPFGLATRLSDANGGDPNDQNDNISLVSRTAGVNLFNGFQNPNNVDISRFLGASSNSLGSITLTVVPTAVPEPSSALVGIFGCVLMMCRRKK